MISIIFKNKGKYISWSTMLVVESDDIQGVKDILNGAMVSSYLTQSKNEYCRSRVQEVLQGSGINSYVVRTTGLESASFYEDELERADEIYDIKYRIYLDTKVNFPFTIRKEVDLTV